MPRDRIVRINASKSYDVIIGEALIENVGAHIRRITGAKRVLLVSDDIVYPLYGELVEKSLLCEGFQINSHIIPNGEASKNMNMLSELLETAAECNLTRQDIMIALGGGVIGDITGFAAAIYMRGIDFVQIPTTLLSAVDASVGGKTAVNLAHGKNLVGAFWQPILVLCDCSTFDSLPGEQFANGMAETIKYGIIRDESILVKAEKGIGVHDLPEIIEKCIEIKRDIVEADEREGSVRMLLNFGHTVGHAVEKMCNFEINHGYAVAIGMVYEAMLAERLGMCFSLANRLENCLKKYDLPTSIDVSMEELIEFMKHDKKNRGDDIAFVLPRKCGNCEVRWLNSDELKGIM